MVNFDIGDIVRVVQNSDYPISNTKYKFVNRVGFIVKFDERYNDFNHVYVRFFDTNETIIINKLNIIKEKDWILKYEKVS